MAAICRTHPAIELAHPAPIGALGPAPEPGARHRSAITRRDVALAALVALAIVVVAAVSVAVGRGALASAAPEPPPASGLGVNGDPPPARAVIVTVRPGDTIWSIAHRLQPSGDVRPRVDQMVAEHGSAPLQPGERLVVTP